MKVSFELTMPNLGSWNGKWSGADKKYYVIRTLRAKEGKEFLTSIMSGKNSNSFHYNFGGDGWSANIHVEIVDAKEALKRTKLSKGFYAYDWMIDSIIKCGFITTNKIVPA